MKTWKWPQPGDRMWRVLADYDKGILVVIDEDGKILIKRSGLTKEVIELVEKNFLDVVANGRAGKGDKKGSVFDPMFA
jgi:hypothetical protein